MKVHVQIKMYFIWLYNKTFIIKRDEITGTCHNKFYKCTFAIKVVMFFVKDSVTYVKGLV